MLRFLSSIVVVVIAHTATAEKFLPVKMVFNDGKVLSGFAKPPKDPMDKMIDFKESEDGKKESYKSEVLKSMVFTLEGETLEYERIKVYGNNGKKIGPAVWLVLLQRGHATLYFAGRGGKTTSYGAVTRTELPERWWYCIRPGEEAAKVVSYAFGMNPNAHFRAFAPDYFKDHADIAEKIKDKVYKWDDIDAVVKEYNASKK